MQNNFSVRPDMEFGINQENNFEFEFESEYNNEFEMNNEFNNEEEYAQEFAMEADNEVLTNEMALELMGVANEEELNYFLGKLISKAAKGISNFAKSPVGKALGGVLKTAAKSALPILGTAAGGFIGGPIGAKIGGQLASGAGKLFGLEMEGMSAEDREFEMARAYVRFANNAARNASHLYRKNPRVAPRMVARTSVNNAARRYAPGLLLANSNNMYNAMPQYQQAQGDDYAATGRTGGRWERVGNSIRIYGVY